MEIAILGAGVAGVATAIALKQRGHAVRVYERRLSQSNLGAGVVLWPNASFVLAELGLLPDIAAVGGRLLTMKRFSDSGEHIGQLNITELDRRMGFPSYSILRRDLQRILLARACEFDIPIYHGKRALDIKSENSSYATVYFDDGDSAQAELVIGADGRMNSCARRYVLGNNIPVFQGVVSWVGTMEARSDLMKEIAALDYWGVGKRFGIVAVNQSTLYWAGSIAASAPSTARNANPKTDITAHFFNWPAIIRYVIEQSEHHRICKVDLYDHDAVEIWHRERVLMIGDAAHASLPTSGQGASQALEDAWHLAQCLVSDDIDLDASLVTFTERRKTKTHLMTKIARDFSSSLFNPDIEACRIRNEQARASNLEHSVASMAEGWGATLPLGQHAG